MVTTAPEPESAPARVKRSTKWARLHPEEHRRRNRLSYQKNPERARERRRQARANESADARRTRSLRKRHGMQLRDVAAMLAVQQNACYLCGESLTLDAAVIDHDHSCCPPRSSCATCRRGLAHDFCNKLIGLAGDDPQKLTRIAAALADATTAARERMASAPQQLALDL